jgi:putative membrane protein
VSSAHAGHGDVDLAGWLLPLALGAAPLVAYLLTVRTYARRRLRPWRRPRTVAFALGCAALGVGLSPVLDSWAHADLRGHMAQHLLVGMYAPLGLVLAAPVSLLLGAVGPDAGRRIAGLLRSTPVHLLGHPVTAAVLSTGGLVVLYLTPVYARSTQEPLLHHLVHLHLLLAGCLFTWAVAGPDPAPGRPGLAMRTAVLVVSAGAHSVLAKLLFARAGELPVGAGLDPAEVEAAAPWMYYGGDVAELALAAALFASWYRVRQRRRSRTSMPGPGQPVMPVSP